MDGCVPPSSLHGAALLAAYDEGTRLEAGMPPAEPWPYGCADGNGEEDVEVTALIDVAANRVASRLRSYHASLRVYYVLTYLENVLSILSGFVGKQGAEARIAFMLDFTRACLVGEVELREE